MCKVGKIDANNNNTDKDNRNIGNNNTDENNKNTSNDNIDKNNRKAGAGDG